MQNLAFARCAIRHCTQTLFIAILIREEGVSMSKSTSHGKLCEGAFARHLPLNCFKTGLSIVLAASFTSILPAAASAATTNALAGWDDAAKEAASSGYQPYTTSNFYAAAATNTTLPASYDLRDPNGDGNTKDSVVSPVKFQNPWGTCWGFATIAACETSVLSKAKTTYAKSNIDLSELQLANSVYKRGGAPAKYVGKAQAGEGYNNESTDPNLGLNTGGWLNFGSNIFASGIGPIAERAATYRNTGVYNNGKSHKDDPVYIVVVTRKSSTGAADSSGIFKVTSKTSIEYLTQSQINALAKDKTVLKYQKKCYAGNYKDSSGKTVYTDWTIESQQKDKTDDSWWNSTMFNLENGNELPDTRNLDANGKFESVNWDAVNIIKDEIYKDKNDSDDFSRAVSVCFAADNSTPGDSDKEAQYISTEWAHYTYKDASANHAVTIIGWDDNYDASNFAKGFENSKEGAAAHTPAGDGAWLVKNSWGSETGDCDDSKNFPSSWGIVDDNGKHTGYFWISYYDKSLCMPESYDFDITSYNDNDVFVVDQYDYLVSDGAVVNGSQDSPIYAANIFKADEDMDLRTMAVATYKTDTTVDFKVYLLDEDAKTPTDVGHSTLAYEGTTTFKYGGYHCFHLDKSDWVPMRKGQRYAVVITQQASDGTYYQGTAINSQAQPTDAELEAYGKAYREAVEQAYRKSFTEYLTEYYSSADGTAERGGLSVEAAVNAALEALMKSADVVAAIDKAVEEAKDNRSKVYFKGVVNSGESMVGKVMQSGSGSDDDEIQWADWTGVVWEVKNQMGNVAVDNASIKAIAEVDDFATVAQLKKLEAAVTTGKQMLKKVVVASNGSKVKKSKKWMTKANYKQLKKAVNNATKQLKKAGSYKTTLTMSTPGSAKVKKATKTITTKIKKTVKKGKAA